MEQFANLHTILQDAKLESYHTGETFDCKTIFRLPKRVREQCHQICRGNGTTLSRFLKKACEQLIHEYQNPVEVNREGR